MKPKPVSTTQKFTFSFVMPIYNVGLYLEDTMESVIAQDMDFETNVQVIFVNDGSTDNSEEVCLRYQRKFPKNIVYVKQENAGLSAARNAGIEHVQGKYTSFLDPDDKLSTDTLSKVYDFFEGHYDMIDFASIKIIFFEAKAGEHMLNYKFGKSRVINVEESPDSIQLSAASSFVKSAIFAKGFRFDVNIKQYAEDMKFLGELVLDKMAFGVVEGPVYFYRKRETGDSILDTTRVSKDWYLKIPTDVHKHLFEHAIKLKGYVPRYLQNVIMYDLQWRFKQVNQDTLSTKEERRYKESLYDLLKYIDDDIILSQKHIYKEYKLFILGKKYQQDVIKSSKLEGRQVIFKDMLIFNYVRKSIEFRIEDISVNGDTVCIRGSVNGFIFPGVKLEFKIGDIFYPVEYKKEEKRYAVSFLNEVVYNRNFFEVSLPASNNRSIVPYLNVGESKWHLDVSQASNVPYEKISATSFRRLGDWIILWGENVLHLQTASPYHLLIREAKRLHALWLSKKYESIRLRLAYYLVRPFLRRVTWLIYDDDVTRSLFDYMRRRSDMEINVYLVSSDPNGSGVLHAGSLRHKLAFLWAEKHVFPFAGIEDETMTDLFEDIIDLANFEKVLLDQVMVENDIESEDKAGEIFNILVKS